jgi:hypothetical protein
MPDLIQFAAAFEAGSRAAVEAESPYPAGTDLDDYWKSGKAAVIREGSCNCPTCVEDRRRYGVLFEFFD